MDVDPTMTTKQREKILPRRTFKPEQHRKHDSKRRAQSSAGEVARNGVKRRVPTRSLAFHASQLGTRVRPVTFLRSSELECDLDDLPNPNYDHEWCQCPSNKPARWTRITGRHI